MKKIYNSKIAYGEILFVGKCNYSCYYCLCNEMKKLQEKNKVHMEKHFSEWPRFTEFLYKLKKNGCTKIYLSSTCSEPLLYKYIDELVDYLIKEGFKIGIRTNGTIVSNKLELFKKFEEEISISLNSFNSSTNKLITGSMLLPNWNKIFTFFTENDIKTRISIVIVEENYREIEEILNLLSEQKCVSYVQIRKRYNYYKNNNFKDSSKKYFEEVEKMIESKCIKVGNYFESPIYKYNNLEVSLWFDVFKKESINTLNYFTDGILTENNLLVEAYEEDSNE